MITFFAIQDQYCTKVTNIERVIFLAYLQKIRKATLTFDWIRDLDLSQIDIKWCSTFNDDNGIMGCFNFIHPNTIYLRKFAVDYPEKVVLSTLVHELNHLYHFHKNPILYLICLIPFLRDITLEVQAKYFEAEVQNRVDMNMI